LQGQPKDENGKKPFSLGNRVKGEKLCVVVRGFTIALHHMKIIAEQCIEQK
jgi:hypothetical protein